MNNKVTFKPYDMNQLKLPIDLAIDIPENHLVKIAGRVQFFAPQYNAQRGKTIKFSFHLALFLKLTVIL